jgi:thioredoxin 1
MKNYRLLLMGILFVAAVSCQGQSGTNKEATADKKPESATTVARTTVASTSLPMRISKDDFLRLIMNYQKNPDTWKYEGEVPCIVDFYADWCGPCKITSPILEEMSREYAGKIKIYEVNVDQERELASLFKVESIPTFLYCPMEGNPTISSGIANTPDATRQMFRDQIEQLLLKKGDRPTM